MTTTAEAESTQTLSPSTLDRALAALTEPDSNLDNIAAVLRALGTVDYEHVEDLPAVFGRVRGLCWFLAKQVTERYDAETRCAPPVALAEVVRDSAVPCKSPVCNNDVLPWQFNGEHCDAACRTEYLVALGERDA